MYNHKEVEETILKFWNDEKVYEKVKKLRKKGAPYYFVDGPPYVTGDIHPGTAWNKTIKDAIIRYHRGTGKNVRDQPGFDTHGLPIEVKVEKLLNIKNKAEIEKIGIERFIKECKKFADKYIGLMTQRFKRLGVWMDWDNPYITYKDEYIEKAWKTMKKAFEKNVLKEGEYVLPYCYRCETTLANYELEYGEEVDPSIFVKFKVKGEENTYLIIWTTTPWTLVANLGVMVHPNYEYAKVKVDDEFWVVAKERLEFLMEKVGKSGIVVAEFKGKELEGKEYEHPFQDLIHKDFNRKVLLTDQFVTLEEGTGLVHMAPGHGPEDFAVGKIYGIEPFSPVDEHGNYTDEAGAFKGMNVREANERIISVLKERGNLIYKEKVRHRYPHCWRCKTPLIYVTTKQWFFTITDFKQSMLKEIDNVKWSPEMAMTRFKLFVENAPDWCISRQRYWGIPLPIWKCKNGHIHVVGTKEELEKLSGVKVKELHRPYVDEITFKCPICKEEMHRVKDVLDVWFDSGNAVWASLSEKDEKEYGDVADLIIEGQDQIRGWFYSLLGSGIIYYGKSPYKAVMMHGFFVDEKGEKMSKSLGNFVPVDEFLEKYGADAFRLFGMSSTIWEDLKFNWNELKEAKNDLNILYNLVTFIKRNYRHTSTVSLEVEDRWILSRLNEVVATYHKSFEELKPHIAVRALRQFIVYDFSQFYMKIAKARIAEKRNEEAAIHTIYTVLLNALLLFSPVTPMIAEYLYLSFFKQHEKADSIFMLNLPTSNPELIDKVLEKRMEVVKSIVSSALKIRNLAKIKARWPLRTLYFKPSNGYSIKGFEPLIKSLVNVKEVKEEEGGDVKDSTEYGIVGLTTSLDKELYNEGIANEIIRRIQLMRKEKGLLEHQKIEVSIHLPDEFKEAFEQHRDRISRRVNAISFKSGKEGKPWKIDGKEVYLNIVVV